MPARLSALIIVSVLTASPLKGASVWSGVYTQAQATRGQAAYASQCSRCHRADLSGYSSVLIGDRFMNDWREDSLNSFFKIVKETMPRDAPASLSDGDYLDIVAYILQANDFPAGANALTLDTLANTRVEGKQGPEPVPDFALVSVVGCLEQSADRAWIVVKASEPVRTRNPDRSPAGELETLKASPLGTHSFRLLDTGTEPTELRDHKVEAKGFLIRQPAGDRINPSSLQSVAGACTPPHP